MPKVEVMYDIDLDYLFEESRPKIRSVKISDEMFDVMLNEGLIEKTEDGYVFVGRYEDTLEIRKSDKRKS
jgi:hypothetical protein